MIAMAVQQTMRTRDGRLRVHIYDDQSAEMSDAQGRLLTERVPLYQVGQKLTELGVRLDELEEEV